MGAGDHPAGEGPAGFDPPAEPAPLRRAEPPRALLFDGATRDFPRDADGRYRDIHPVDQEVALALLVELGAVGPAPATGSTLRAIPHAGGPTLKADVRNRIHLALARPLAAKDIEEIAITVTTPRPGAIRVIYDYLNLRAPGVPARGAPDPRRRRIELSPSS